MPDHAIQVSRPFEIVTRQILDLDEAWLEDAVRSATRRGVACRRTPPGSQCTTDAHVRLGRPRWGRGLFRLPMEWEVMGNVAPWALRGELEVCQVGPGETRIGVKMAVAPNLGAAEDWKQAGADESAEIAAQSFLQRVFWTLEALSRFDQLDPPGGKATGFEGDDRPRSPDQAFSRESR